MYIYIILLLLIIVFFRCFKGKNSRFALLLSFFLFFLIAALRRYDVGSDTLQYYSSYDLIGKSNWDFSGFRFELLYCVLVKVLYAFDHSPQTLIIISSLIINVSFYIFVRNNSKNYFLSTLLYLLLNMFFTNMNIMREALALSVCLASFSFLKKGRYVLYIMFSVVSMLFHYVGFLSIFVFILYIISRHKTLKKIFVAFMIVFALFGYFFIEKVLQLFNSQYIGYLSSEFANGGNVGAIMEFLMYSFILMLLFIYHSLFCKELRKSRKNTYYFYDLITLCICVFLFLVIRINIFNRFSCYLLPFSIVIIPNYIVDIYRHKKRIILSFTKRQVINSIALICFVYWLIIAICRPEWSGCSNYMPFWINSI